MSLKPHFSLSRLYLFCSFQDFDDPPALFLGKWPGLHHFYLITDTAGVFLVVGLELLCPAHDPLVQGCLTSVSTATTTVLSILSLTTLPVRTLRLLCPSNLYPLGPLDPQFPLTHDGLDPGNLLRTSALHRVIQLTGGHLNLNLKSSSLSR